ncbi:uncharacterized protein METZ01_LOCUS164134 [marine metagenome]|uniref:Uncharacterized protein n=1 Tax=marine metagenome TaxID=408172 RepID=A0A382BBT2_9ZZZZ
MVLALPPYGEQVGSLRYQRSADSRYNCPQSLGYSYEGEWCRRNRKGDHCAEPQRVTESLFERILERCEDSQTRRGEYIVAW